MILALYRHIVDNVNSWRNNAPVMDILAFKLVRWRFSKAKRNQSSLYQRFARKWTVLDSWIVKRWAIQLPVIHVTFVSESEFFLSLIPAVECSIDTSKMLVNHHWKCWHIGYRRRLEVCDWILQSKSLTHRVNQILTSNGADYLRLQKSHAPFMLFFPSSFFFNTCT